MIDLMYDLWSWSFWIGVAFLGYGTLQWVFRI